MHITFIGHRPELNYRKDDSIFSRSVLNEPDFPAVYNVKNGSYNGDYWRRDNEQDERAEAIKKWLKDALVQG